MVELLGRWCLGAWLGWVHDEWVTNGQVDGGEG